MRKAPRSGVDEVRTSPLCYDLLFIIGVYYSSVLVVLAGIAALTQYVIVSSRHVMSHVRRSYPREFAVVGILVS
jgi:hypothetical protein